MRTLLAIMADLHLMERKPKYRRDKTKQVLLNKFVWIIEKAIYEGAEALFIAGDMFDSSRVSQKFISKVCRLLVSYIEDIRIIAVAGQHDKYYRTTDLSNTPLGVLASAGLIEIAHWSYPIEFDNFNVWGINFGEEDELINLSKSASVADILLIHKMITKGKPLWPGQSDWIGAKAFLRSVPFKYVFSGDNHQRIITNIGDRVLINSGSLLRKTKAQMGFQPILTLLSYENGTYEEYPIPISPPEEAFDTNKITIDESKNITEQSMVKLVDTIRSENITIDPKKILKKVIKMKQTSTNITDIVDDIMEKVLSTTQISEG